MVSGIRMKTYARWRRNKVWNVYNRKLVCGEFFQSENDCCTCPKSEYNARKAGKHYDTSIKRETLWKEELELKAAGNQES